MEKLVLITNDDGVNAAGIQAMRRAVARFWEAIVVAPDREQSARSHALTLDRPLRVQTVEENVLAVDGTPTDCMMLALRSILRKTPDLAISGINHGANLGNDVIYSGTVAGATEAALLGVPSIAVSAVDPSNTDFDATAVIVLRIAEQVMRSDLPRGVFFNVNIPSRWNGRFEITSQGIRQYRDVITEKMDPRGRPYYWIGGELEKIPGADQSDVAALDRGSISITPLHLDMTATHVLKEMESWRFE